MPTHGLGSVASPSADACAAETDDPLDVVALAEGWFAVAPDEQPEQPTPEVAKSNRVSAITALPREDRA